ncbi:PilN domain-containing protein [Luteibacter yeojuensis]|uniref:PilN domain-containing protein n=1 Tax=Luteibacter yeojuensis TaxID=345309 RepID=A0A7X5TQ15_9GAMM|nr:PilN domain-containing protein [Luteibacter yeojuensis]NID16036.1 PilN domain-containing protein [Luteibacter yeojuensis]
MARINLLPWRAERRKQREREFYIQLGLAFGAALVVLIAWSFWMDARINNQGDRNTYLQGEIKQLDDRIAKIKDLEKVRADLLQRKQIIEQLQANRSQMVHLFDELVKTIPASARLSGMKQSATSMSLDGISQSNSGVAEYMRNIEASPWMGHVDLRKTENTHDGSRMPYRFGLDVRLSSPADTAPAGSSTAAAPAKPAALPVPSAQAAGAATPARPAPNAAPAAQTPAAAAAPAGAKP